MDHKGSSDNLNTSNGQLIILLSEVAGDMKAVRATVDAGTAETGRLREDLRRLEDKFESQYAETVRRVATLENKGAWMAGAAAVLASLGTYIASNFLRLP